MEVHGITGDLFTGVLSTRDQAALDDRQRRVTRAILDHWLTQGFEVPYPLIAMPTGFGKGRIIHQLLEYLSHDKVLIIVGTKNILLNQSLGVLQSLTEFELTDQEYSLLPDTRGRFVLATWQGLAAYMRTRAVFLPQFGLAVIDEVHNAGTVRRLALLHRLKAESVVGLTATAYRSSGKYRRPEEYGFTILDSLPLPLCINDRWLSPLVGIALDTKLTLPAGVLENGQPSMVRVSQEIRKHRELFATVGDELCHRFLPEGMKTIVVVNHVDEAVRVAETIVGHGYAVGLAVNQRSSQHLQSWFPTFDAIARYQLPHEHPDALQVLVSPQVIGEGFDAPATECIVWAAPTFSGLRYTQVVGRGARRCQGKRYCLVIDFLYMIEKYGYSYHFAQFFRKQDLRLLEGGALYVGPPGLFDETELPAQYTAPGRIVCLFNLPDDDKPPLPKADGWLTLWQLARQTGTSNDWIRKQLTFTDAYPPEERIGVRGNTTPHYPPACLDYLRARVAQLPPPKGDWLTVSELAKRVGKSPQWVVKQLAILKVRSEQRTVSGHRPYLHYPPSAIADLQALCLDSATVGERHNVLQLARILKKSQTWIRSRLKSLGVEPIVLATEPTYLCYPATVVPRLIGLRDLAPPAGDWLCLKEIRAAIGHSGPFIQKSLKAVGIQGEDRLTKKKGRKVPHYPPSVLDELREHFG